MLNDLLSDAGAEYIGGVLVLITGVVVSSLVKTWRQRRPSRPDQDSASDRNE